jgi:predicted aspartyl protease
MGTFRVAISVENPTAPGVRRTIPSALVDTGAALSWLPKAVLEDLAVRPVKEWRFRQADGTVLLRWTAEVRLFVSGTSTIDEVVCGEPTDLVLLGARSLEGLNLRVDPIRMELVDAGPAPAAVVF